MVPDSQLSLAIGKEGQNARLAAKLTTWKIDIKSQTQVAELMQLQQANAPASEVQGMVISDEYEDYSHLPEDDDIL